ncbi:MAG TPA: LLM class F420-dependent oxidoreductase [Candidatus Binataceae bacterium]|nr:LLM class F420-dependent oxidoreductase [Candidatus Binataceae bacterium]
MKVGLISIGIGAGTAADSIKTIAMSAERLGFATLWAPEHVVLIEGYKSRYPYAPSGEVMGRLDSPLLDPWVGLGYAAAFTKRVRLATGVCLVPEHNPLALAKAIATVDHLSGGRVVVGIGIGWLEEEFQAMGIAWERRSDRTRDYVAAMRRLWGEDVSAFSGEFARFSNVRSFPKPAAGGKLPVVVGGNSMPALRRVAEYGDGWFGLNLSPDATAERLVKLRGLLSAQGRKLDDLEIIIGPASHQPTSDDFRKYHDLGVKELVLPPFGPRSEADMIKRLEEIARRWVEPAAAAG